jgi:FHS family L-fucose permease-like MFS transporter
LSVFSRIGYVTPLIATALIYNFAGEIRFHFPYLLLAALIMIIGGLIFFSKMPAMKADIEDKFSVSGIFKASIRYPHLVFGIVAMFFYVGAEACTAGFFIPYLKTVLGFTETQAARYLTLYYIFAAVMGLTAVIILRYIKASRLVGFFGLAMITCYLICILTNTGINEYILASLGLFLSIMFPTIFSLAIEDIGAFAGRGSALLNFAIVGGSVFPPLQGIIADNFGVNVSYLVPCFCFVVITIYAFFFTKYPLMKRNFSLFQTLHLRRNLTVCLRLRLPNTQLLLLFSPEEYQTLSIRREGTERVNFFCPLLRKEVISGRAGNGAVKSVS